MLGKLGSYVTRSSICVMTAALIAGLVGCDGCHPPPSQNLEIRTWYDLDAIRKNLGGSYVLMNDLDSTTAGYAELASPTAHGGKGWHPIGSWDAPFTGSLAGQGHEIQNLCINRPDEDDVGLFAAVGQSGVIKNVGVTNATVHGLDRVGGLVGFNSDDGVVTNSFWDTQTSGQTTSGGGTGKTTAQMKNIATFSGVGWYIIAVALNGTSPAYIWNIVNGVTYPFLSWQP